MADFPIPLYPVRVDEDDIDTQMTANEEMTEFTLKVRSIGGRPLTNADVILEVEYLINEWARADDKLRLPDTVTH